MINNPLKHHRRSIRLPGYDYTQPGSYFVTICTQQHEHVLGKIKEGEVHLSPAGQIAHQFWTEITTHFPGVNIDTFIIMPNHVHAIITILYGRGPHAPGPHAPGETPPGGGTRPGEEPQGGETPQDGGTLQGGETPPGEETSPLLGQIVAYYKYQTTKRINALTANPGTRFWQRNYYEHIIRNKGEYMKIWAYILDNPLRWQEDRFYSTTLHKI